jgi:ABC-2 type transport system permease protein
LPPIDTEPSVVPPNATEPSESPEVLEISRRPGPFARVATVWRYRELLVNLSRKELKVKYKNSVLGFVWSLLNPALYLVVFTIVFQYFLNSNVPLYAIFLLSGVLAWNLFSASLGGGTGSIVGNAALVQKVWFPREILPLASIGAALVHFFLQMFVLLGALAIFHHAPSGHYAVVLPVAMIVLLLFSAGLAIALAAINVYLRDTQHLLELVLLAWFWMSAIVYPYQVIADKFTEHSWVPLLNPMIPIVLAFQRVIYNPAPGTKVLPADADVDWYLRNLAIVGVASIALMVVALWLFGRLEDNFAEEI